MPASADLSIKAGQRRQQLRGFCVTVEPDHECRDPKNPLDIPYFIAQTIKKKVASKCVALMPFILMLVGRPLSISEANCKDIYDDVIKSRHRSAAGTAVATRLKNVPFENVWAVKQQLKPVRYYNLECRVSHVCDFCDLIAACSFVVGLSLADTYKGFGSSFGHHHASRGLTPFSQLGIEVDSMDMDEWGVASEDYTAVATLKQKPVPLGRLRAEGIQEGAKRLLEEHVPDTVTSVVREDSEVAVILEQPLPPQPPSEVDEDEAVDPDAITLAPASPCYNAVSPVIERSLDVVPPNISKKRSADGFVLKKPVAIPSTSKPVVGVGDSCGSNCRRTKSKSVKPAGSEMFKAVTDDYAI